MSSRKILITGLIGSGKSTVSKLIESRGHVVLNLDDIVKKLYNTPAEEIDDVYGLVQFRLNLITLFSTKVIKADHTIDSDYLARQLFDEKQYDKRWNFYKHLNKLLKQYIDHLNIPDNVPIFIEAASLKEIELFMRTNGIEDVILVETDAEERRGRVLRNRPISEAQLKKFEQFQTLDNSWVKNDFYDRHKVRFIKNDKYEELPDKVADVLEKLNFTWDEKRAVLYRQLMKAPAFATENTQCYFNSNIGGCDKCPFPCIRAPKKWEAYLNEYEKRTGHKVERGNNPPLTMGTKVLHHKCTYGSDSAGNWKLLKTETEGECET